MLVLGIETSCDECAAAVVEDGRYILSNIVASQIPFHERWGGVVPEIASRKHIEWISGVVDEALAAAGLSAVDIDAAAATEKPGLLGSLLVGLTFARMFAFTRGIPFIPVNHLDAHLYAVNLEYSLAGRYGAEPRRGGCPKAPAEGGLRQGGTLPPLKYPYLGLLVSGGHSLICRVDDFDKIEVLGASLDDAAGEAFDKVGKHYGLSYPAGKYAEAMAREGDAEAFDFPLPKLGKGARPYDMSFSGLKNAAVNQLETFRRKKSEEPPLTRDIIASFQKAAVEILLRALFRAVDETGLTTVAAGGGVAANAYLRSRLSERSEIHAVFPPSELCGDNGAMVAGYGGAALMGRAGKRAL